MEDEALKPEGSSNTAYFFGYEKYLEDSFSKRQPPVAFAEIKGGPLRPEITGTVFFEQAVDGVWVTVDVTGLPSYRPAKNGRQPVGPFGFHLHQKGDCTEGDPKDPFLAAGGHWNPDNQPHGNHAGDFPVLFSNDGTARMMFFTDRFYVSDILGKAVMIHKNPDDYRTQPGGNSGKRLACGVIREYRLTEPEEEE